MATPRTATVREPAPATWPVLAVLMRELYDVCIERPLDAARFACPFAPLVERVPLNASAPPVVVSSADGTIPLPADFMQHLANSTQAKDVIEFWEKLAAAAGPDDADLALRFLIEFCERLGLQLTIERNRKRDITSAILRLPHAMGKKLGISILVLHRSGGLNSHSHFRSMHHQKGLLSEEVADRIARRFWAALHDKVHAGFCPKGEIWQTRPQQFVRFTEVEVKDRLGAIARCVKNAVEASRGAVDELTPAPVAA